MHDIATMTVAEIRDLLQGQRAPGQDFLYSLQMDKRQGVRKLAERYSSVLAKEHQDVEAAINLLQFERALWRRGFRHIAGVDEVGCGPLAGPIVAAAVVWPVNMVLPRLKDSKRLAKKEREELYQIILSQATSVAVAQVDNQTIDQYNIRQSNLMAMEQAVNALTVKPDYLLTDAWRLPRWPGLQLAIFSGDAYCQSIAAASVVAKTVRDELMSRYHEQYPDYGFGQHKGYPTPEHWRALERFGPTPIHRISFLGRMQKGNPHD